MKNFTRLMLASAIAMSSSAFAMEAMEDEALAEMTGQDGVTINITPPAAGISMSNIIHDSNGVAGAVSAGAIVLGVGNQLVPPAGMVLTSIDTPGVTTIDMVIDATGDIDSVTAGNQAALNIGITIPSGTIINTGTLSAAKSNGGGVAITDQTGIIMDNASITLGATTLVMTLGSEVATTGQMMNLNTTMTGGLDIANFALKDANGGGTGGSAIRATNIAMDDAGAGTNLAIVAKVDVVPTGLQLTTTQIGVAGTGAGTGFDMSMTGVKLGDTTAIAIGTVDVIGLNMNGTLIKIAGH